MIRPIRMDHTKFYKWPRLIELINVRLTIHGTMHV
jgi:hypothetical protein